MRGLLVVGAVHGADEAAVGIAASGALERAGERPAVLAAVAVGPGAADAAGGYPTAASPLTAARHAGDVIDPGPLVVRVREAAAGGAVVATAAGGMLAPLTPRYAVRDLARELRLPVLLAVPAGPDATALARLSLESARGAGVRVAGVVLTRWPDPPDRVLLDERRLLGELAGTEVLVLGTGSAAREEAARAWPAGRWLDVTDEPPTGPAPAPAPVNAAPAPAGAGVVLEPYVAWTPTPQGDPRETPRPRIMEAMLAIASAEGPILAGRAYALYNRAAGGKKLTTIARAPLSSAIYWLAREQKVVLTRKEEIPWQDDDVVRLPDTAAVRVRELGPRTLDEVPLDEIAELMQRLGAAHGVRDPAGLKRLVLDAYGLKRLTTRADEYLGLALDL
jgi:hypothetical protein